MYYSLRACKRKSLKTFFQIQGIVNWAQTFIYLLKNDEHHLNIAFPDRTLPTGITWDYKKKVFAE